MDKILAVELNDGKFSIPFNAKPCVVGGCLAPQEGVFHISLKRAAARQHRKLFRSVRATGPRVSLGVVER